MPLMKALIAGAVLAIGSSASSTLEEVSAGFVWAENLLCDAGRSTLWVSDTVLGTLSAVTYDSGKNAYSTRVHLSGLDKIDGLAMDKTGLVIYAGANMEDESGGMRYTVIEVDGDVPESYKIVADLPLAGSECGNGLAMDWTSGLLYTTTEGGFKPHAGEVFEVDPVAGTSRSYAAGLFSADGAYIDQDLRLLYISQVLDSKVLVFELNSTVADGEAIPTRTIKVDNMGMLDDFFLSSGGKSLIGADFLKGKVVSIPLDAATGITERAGKQEESVEASILAEGLTSPTSARQGCSAAGFEESAIFVSEGGGFLEKMDSRRVMKVMPSSPQ